MRVCLSLPPHGHFPISTMDSGFPRACVTNVVERHFGSSTFVHTRMDDEGYLEYA